MSLAAQQQAFMAQVMDDEAPGTSDPRTCAGMAIYRSGYRARMVEVLEDLYERTREAAGDALFRQAAINHLIAHPHAGWRIEACGRGFADTIGELAPEHSGLDALASLEWSMHEASRAADAAPLTLEQFGRASSAFAEEDWQDLRLDFQAGVAVIATGHDLSAFWRGQTNELVPLADAASALVWREGERPTFLQVSAAEGHALSAMQAGASYGEACGLLIEALGEEVGVSLAGEALGRWIGEGLVSALA